MRIEDYAITRSRGFLADFVPAAVELPEALAEMRGMALALPRLLPGGRIRTHIGRLAPQDLTQFCRTATEPELRMAMVHYSFLAQAYVWGEPQAPRSLPVNLALPLWQLAERLGQQPLLPYSGYVLDNWGQIDPAAGFEMSNLHVLQSFLGGQDEAWFVLIHVAIEASAGEMLWRIPGLIAAAEVEDGGRLETDLAAVCRVWDRIIALFDRMPERCDPYIYFHRVRPWIHGWKDNPHLPGGLVYEGVAVAGGRPQAFRGQTGSQSSIVPVMDALLGVGHARDPLRTYLDELHLYRPPGHRRFIEDVRARSSLREAVRKLESRALTTLYNDCVTRVTRFRTRHLEYAATYINRQSRGAEGNATEIGTGGTPFMKYLRKHRGETENFLLPMPAGRVSSG